jgi:hypothetical protein
MHQASLQANLADQHPNRRIQHCARLTPVNHLKRPLTFSTVAIDCGAIFAVIFSQNQVFLLLLKTQASSPGFRIICPGSILTVSASLVFWSLSLPR